MESEVQYCKIMGVGVRCVWEENVFNGWGVYVCVRYEVCVFWCTVCPKNYQHDYPSASGIQIEWTEYQVSLNCMPEFYIHRRPFLLDLVPTDLGGDFTSSTSTTQGMCQAEEIPWTEVINSLLSSHARLCHLFTKMLHNSYVPLMTINYSNIKKYKEYAYASHIQVLCIYLYWIFTILL